MADDITAQPLQYIKQAHFSDLRNIPGPYHARWTRLGLKLQIMQGRRTQYIHALHLNYGPFVRIAPNEVSVADLDAFRTIHRIGGGFLKSGWYTSFVGDVPPGIFSMIDPKQHAQRRRLLAQGFSKSNILNYEQVVREKVDLAVSKIERDAKIGGADILKWFTYMATDVIGHLNFGKSFEMLEHEKKNQYIIDLETTMMISGIKSESGVLLTIASYLPVDRVRKAMQLEHRLIEYGKQAIQNCRDKILSKHETDTPSLFERCLDTSKGQPLSDFKLASEGSNLIVAGSDTTGVSATYIIYNILKPEHQQIRDKILKEIEDIPIDASATRLVELVYLRAIIDEGMRLFGAAPASLPRTVPAGGVTLGGYYLPAGTEASTQAYSMHRDPSIFPDPETFNPDRWLDATQAMRDAYSPFGAGSRVCLGIHLAMLELCMVTFKFLKQCPTAELCASTTPESMEIENFFLIVPKSHRCDIKM
ncbi:sterigmatocystin biosynthesis P450 monooxygenase [Delphinella strobiligena]|nr:sterigmatocystin biosynthesis P450 monooxygenase [Delphinella strobiligena]